MAEPNVVIMQRPQPDVKDISAVRVVDFIGQFCAGCIRAAQLIAVVNFEDGDVWIVYCALEREGRRWRLFPPRPLPADVFHAIRREAVRFVHLGEGGRV